jgi:4-phytase/acid phosphatase
MSQALQPTSNATTTVLVGHDSNVAAVASLLDLHWQAAGFAADDPSPSGALGLHVLRDAAGHRFIQAFFRSPSLEQIRGLRPVRGREVRRALPITACAPTPLRCPEERFANIVQGVLG